MLRKIKFLSYAEIVNFETVASDTKKNETIKQLVEQKEDLCIKIEEVIQL